MSSRSETPLKSCCKYGFKVLKIENWCLFADGAVARYTQSSVIRYLNSSSQIKESLNGQTFFLAKMYLGGYAYSEEFDVENNYRSRQTCLLTIWAARNEKAITSRNMPIKWQVWSIIYL